MLLKMLVSPVVWLYLVSSFSLLTSKVYDRAVEIFYTATEVEPEGMDQG